MTAVDDETTETRQTTGQTRALDDLRPDPRNREIFDALEGADLQELAASIRANGLINPVTIRPDGTIIAGEQRYRAAQMAGLSEVPVVVFDVPDRQVVVLRLEENLRRRTLKPSEWVRAIRQLYELSDIKNGRPSPPKSPQTNPTLSVGFVDEESSPTLSVGDMAETVGISASQFRLLNRLGDLIDPLMDLLDGALIGQRVADHLARLSPEDQAMIARLHANAALDLTNEPAVRAMKVQLQDAEARAAEVERLQQQLDRVRQEKDAVLAEKDAEMAGLQSKHQEALKKLDYIEQWKKDDDVHKTLLMFARTSHLDPGECATRIRGVITQSPALVLADCHIAEAAILWLQQYLDAVSAELGRGGLRRVD